MESYEDGELSNENEDFKSEHSDYSKEELEFENNEEDEDEEDDYEVTEGKKNSRQGKRKYCFCQSSRTDEFMIQCDQCREWFHGPCVQITAKKARRIKKYYCILCQTNMKRENQSTSDKGLNISTALENTIPVEQSDKKRIDDDYSPDDYEDDDDDEFRIAKERKTHKRRYRKNVSKEKPNKSNQKTQKRGRKKGQSNKTKENRGRGRKKNIDKKFHDHRHGRSKGYSDESADETKSNLPRQCYGPGCIYSARKGSKYCSDNCGLNLARKRIMNILPQRIKDWQSVPTDADERDRKEFEEITQEIMKANNILNEIEKKKKELEQTIRKGKSCIPYTEEESAAILENESDQNDTINCVTCSQEVSLKIALKHMDRCFNKIESQTSFGSNYKTKNEKLLLCEAYNSINKTYCKRLRILCPEHTKEPRIADDEVCGCPLRSDETPFEDSRNNFCRLLRKKCNIHYGWEKIRQAVLDAEIVSLFFKMDELLERQKKIRQAMNNRGGLVALLLHRTKYETETTKNELDTEK